MAFLLVKRSTVGKKSGSDFLLNRGLVLIRKNDGKWLNRCFHCFPSQSSSHPVRLPGLGLKLGIHESISWIFFGIAVFDDTISDDKVLGTRSHDKLVKAWSCLLFDGSFTLREWTGDCQYQLPRDRRFSLIRKSKGTLEKEPCNFLCWEIPKESY